MYIIMRGFQRYTCTHKYMIFCKKPCKNVSTDICSTIVNKAWHYMEVLVGVPLYGDPMSTVEIAIDIYGEPNN